MLGVAGLLRNRDIDFVDQAFAYYRLDEEERSNSDFGRIREDLHLHGKEENLRVRLLGVFDTVGSLGVPMPALEAATQLRVVNFHDTKISELIENAYQALAVDELRGPFELALWTTEPRMIPKPGGGTAQQKIRQVWFPGVHSDIGGGYSDKAFGDVVLDWMLDVASSLGLVLRDDYVARELRPNHSAKLHNSLTRGWSAANAIPGITKAGPRPIGNQQRQESGRAIEPDGRSRLVPTEIEVLHWSLKRRIAAAAEELPPDQSPYRPVNVCDARGTILAGLQQDGLRWENRLSARQILNEPGELDGRSAEILDLSRGGARVRLEGATGTHPLAADRAIELVSLSVGARSCSIVWHRDNEVGVAFGQAA